MYIFTSSYILFSLCVYLYFHIYYLVYATTAANPSESSYACYYDKERKTYLGDLYSVLWMEDSDSVCKKILLEY